MKTLIRAYFKFLSIIAPRWAASQAFELFQRPLNKKIRKQDLALYKYANHFQIAHEPEDIQCYDLGPLDGPLTFMVHGWESNAGSFSKMAFRLAEKGNRVILFNLPAHGYSKQKKLNLKISKEVFLKVIAHFNPQKPFSVVSHSFGSAITSYALSKMNYQIDQLIFLTSPNRMTDIFSDFASFISLSKNAYQLMCKKADRLLMEPISEINVEDLGNTINYQHLYMIHDESDKIISKSMTDAICEKWDRSDFMLINGSGHYRMLWDQGVIKKVLSIFEEKEAKKKNIEVQFAIAV